jgi:AAA+ ATPase superfamily predicted ATPase
LISLGRSEEVLTRISRDLNSYIGKPFEEIAKEFLWETSKGNFSKMGRWWHKGEKIDIVALNEEGDDILFFECKWSKLNEREALKIITDLEQKAALVQWHDSGRKEHYGIIAKEIEGKEKLREKGYKAFDLSDLNVTFTS